MGGRDHSCEVCGKGGLMAAEIGECECEPESCPTCGSKDPRLKLLKRDWWLPPDQGFGGGVEFYCPDEFHGDRDG